jgi:hydroxypyruvate isomerase
LVKFSVCVEMVFNGLPFLQRLEKVRDAGLSAFEFWGWLEKDIEAVNRKRKELGMKVTSFVIQPPINSLTVPNVKEDFKNAVRLTLNVAQKLDCGIIIAPVGLGAESFHLSREEQLSNAVENFKSVVPMLEDAGVTTVIEPVNPIDHRGCFLTRCSEGFQLIRAIDSPNVKLLYDFYHQQISEGNLIANAASNFDLIGFFHIGDVPGRHEPGTGEINYVNIFKFLDSQGYRNYVSLEFVPTIDPVEAVRQTVRLASES